MLACDHSLAREPDWRPAGAPTLYINSWFAPRAWLARNSDLARRLTRAVYDTARWSNANHALTAPILANYSKLDEQTVRAMTRVPFATTLDARLLQPVLDTAHEFNQLDKINAETLIVRV